MIIRHYSWLITISHDYSWLGPGPGLAGVAPNDQSLPSRVQFFHQSGPYESYGGLPATIRRRISIRVFLDGSQGRLKQLLHQKSRIWIWDLDPGSTGIPGKLKESRNLDFSLSTHGKWSREHNFIDSGGPRGWGWHRERGMRFWSEKDSFSPWAGSTGIYMVPEEGNIGTPDIPP